MSWIGSQEPAFSEIGMTQDKMDLLGELVQDSDYWKRAWLFVKAVASRKLSSLSSNQRKWLTEIILDLDREMYDRAWRQ